MRDHTHEDETGPGVTRELLEGLSPAERHRWPRLRAEIARALAAEGHAPEAIARALGCPVATVRRALRGSR